MPESGDLAVLTSGGIDSATLVVKGLVTHRRVFPIYVAFGLRWEAAERSALERFLQAVARPGLMPLTVLDEPMVDIYGSHWSTDQARSVPDAESPDASVYLPGRNLLLIGKAAVWCKLRGIATLAIGCLAANPFADGSSAFVEAFEAAINLGMPGEFRIVRPFAGMRKTDVLRLGRDLPLDLTISCLNPEVGRPCGRCNKCAERRNGFLDAGMLDRLDSTSPEPDRTDAPCIGSHARSRSVTATGS